MREILFRAYAKDIKEIKEVVFINLERKFATLSMGYADIDKKHEWTSMYKFEDIELMQFTGLTDKNGTKIFEGDIVLDGWNEYTPVFQNGIYMAYNPKHLAPNLPSTQFNVIWKNGCEVIGNIHEKGK